MCIVASCFLSRIIDLLREQKKLKREYLEILLKKHLTTLDLSDENGRHVADYICLASFICPVRNFQLCISQTPSLFLQLKWFQELTTLKLNGLRHEGKAKKKKFLDSDDYLREINFLPWLYHFQNLQVLNLSFTQASDSCLCIIGVYCTQLKYVSSTANMTKN